MNPTILCTPGPTPVPERVQEAMAQPMIHHRSDEFQQVFSSTRQKLKSLCGTSGETMVFTSSGSGALEASVASLFSKGDAVLIIVAGKFGERWQELAHCYQLNATVIEVPWGKAVGVQDVYDHLHNDLKGVMIQACETSTGVFHPVTEIGQAIQTLPDCLYLVDAITAIGIDDLNMDRDGMDVMVGGSQKALMCPPGLATIALSEKAMGHIRPAASMYFSLAHEWKAQSKNDSAFTPAISLFRGLLEALCMIEEEGKDKVFERHTHLQKRTRQAFRSMRLPLLNADQDAAHGLTAVGLLDWNVGGWLETLKKQDNLWLAGGQERLKGKIFRFAHMGHCDQGSVDLALSMIHARLPHVHALPPWSDMQKELP